MISFVNQLSINIVKVREKYLCVKGKTYKKVNLYNKKTVNMQNDKSLQNNI